MNDKYSPGPSCSSSISRITFKREKILLFSYETGIRFIISLRLHERIRIYRRHRGVVVSNIVASL